jgi:hypothetical protein
MLLLVVNGVCVVTNFERLLAPGSAERPSCSCGEEMHLKGVTDSVPARGTETRVYCCPACQREVRLTVWAEPVGDMSTTPEFIRRL